MKRLLAIGLMIALTSTANAADWGDLTGQIVYDGKAPAPQVIKPNRDIEFCGKFDLVTESIVVDEETNGLANVVVFLYPGRGKKVDVHPDYEKTANDKVTFDNKGCAFVPHVVTLRTSQTLVLGNADQVGHNAKIDCFANASFNSLIPAGGNVEQKFEREERLPVTASCNIHPWMNARIVIKDHPYMAVSGKDGKFEIKNVPAGEWTFQFWHEESGYVQNVKIGGKKTKWSKGRVDVEITPDGHDMGVIAFAP